MRIPSDAWKDNQKNQLTSEGFVEVSYKVSDPDLPVAAAEADEGGALYLSNLPEEFKHPLIDNEERKVAPYATLEQDLWLLNGSKTTVPDDGEYGYSGYISSVLCGSDKEFDPVPVFIITFNEIVSILPGLTITWGAAHEDYPAKFKVKTYNGDKSCVCKTVDNNDTVTSIVDFEMRNFDRVEIKILKWSHPFRRARIGKIFMGINKVYTKSDLLKFSCSEGIDLVSASLPKYEIQFEIDNRDDAFNPTNQEGLTKYMMERQEIKTRYGYRLGDSGETEWIPGGVYYLSEWSAPQNGLSASFKARDLLGFLNAHYYKGTYEPDGISLYDLAEKVLKEARLPNGDKSWDIDETLRDIRTKAPLPVFSLGECLQLIANAARCTLSFDRFGVLHIAPLGDPDEEFVINDDNSYSKAEINLEKPIKQIDVTMYSYMEEAKKELYKGMLILDKGRNVFAIEYSDTAHNIKAEVTGNGITVVSNETEYDETGYEEPEYDEVEHDETEYYAKYCKLVLDSVADGATCDVTICGTVLKQTEMVVTIPNQATGETQPLKNVLITSVERAQAVGTWLKQYLSLRKRFDMDWRIDPCLDTGDIAKITNGTLENKMRVISSSFNFNGAFKGKSEGVEME